MIIFLREMTKIIPGSYLIGNEDVEVSGVEYHSKMVKPGCGFVAISGYQQDGNAYADEAIEGGAVVIITEKERARTVPQMIVPDARAALADLAAKFYANDSSRLKVCGVTGTNGKTTSCFLIKRLMEARAKKVGLITSLVYDTGKERISATRTTPESLDIFRLLFAMRKNHCVNAVLEISSHALMLHRVKNVNINVALFTNLSRDHLDFHSDMNDYLEAKARLLDFVREPSKWAIINIDSPEFKSLIPRITCGHMTYSLENSEADIYLKSFELMPKSTRMELVTPMGKRVINYSLPGRFNLYNALGAVGAALASGVDIDSVVEGLESARTVPGRLERIESNAPFTVYLDFAHTPDALTRTIETVKEMGKGRVLTLFGCGGDRDRGKRPLMAEAVTQLSDYSVLTNDNSRTEDPEQIFEDVKPGFKAGAKVEIIADRREAIAHLIGMAKVNDKIILAGKGDENYQEINGVKHPWSDRDIAREELMKNGFEAR